MNRLLALIAFIFIFSSCADHSKNELDVYRCTEEGFEVSNEIILNNTNDVYETMKRNISDPLDNDIKKKWLEIALNIKTLSDDMVKHINRLQNGVVDEAGRNYQGKTISYNKDNTKAVERLFYKQEKGKALYFQLIKFKENLLGLDSSFIYTFKDRMNLFTEDFDTTKSSQTDFNDYFFKNIPAIGAMAVLEKFKNNVRIIENHCVNFCSAHSYVISDNFNESFRYVMAQSSTIVKSDQTIEVTAGIGSFSTAPQPVFSVNGKTIYADDDGIITYKFKSAAYPGKYKIPVTLSFTKPDGTKDTIKRNIEYTVAD